MVRICSRCQQPTSSAEELDPPSDSALPMFRCVDVGECTARMKAA